MLTTVVMQVTGSQVNDMSRYQCRHSDNTTWQVFGVPPERPA
jgi:hypothetical protein